jgi:hypothetical protein
MRKPEPGGAGGAPPGWDVGNLDALDSRGPRKAVLECARERNDAFRAPFHLDKDVRAEVLHETAEAQAGGGSVHRWPKPHSLDRAAVEQTPARHGRGSYYAPPRIDHPQEGV